MSSSEETNYVVVGAGSAGCVVANRLSATGAKVVLLEAGPKDWHPLIHIPAGLLSLMTNPAVNWNYSSEPEEGTAGRAIHWPRGRVLGGSSSINGMLYVRGNPSDYDTWAQMGCRGWSYEDVLPLFKKSETFPQGEDEYRGRDGELLVENHRTVLGPTHRFVEAAQEAGYPYSEDLNGRLYEGVGYAQMTRRGRFRGSTARTFLRAATRRANLQVRTHCVVTRLRMEHGRCVGLSYTERGAARELRADAEVVLCGGAVNSPQLLQVSGVGPGDHLRSIGVKVVQDLPGVGANLQDHYVVRVMHRLKRGQVSLNEVRRPPRLWLEAARWLALGDGVLTNGVTAANHFCASPDGQAGPDLQLLFTPESFDPDRFGDMDRFPGATIAVCPLRPQSRGEIMARSADPLEAPAIRPRYLSAADDYRVLLKGVAIAREVLSAPAFVRISEGETSPGPQVTSDEALREFARNTAVTLYHPVGTCKMGEDRMAVVDPELRVHGIEGLRVADASIMPNLTSGNTNAPTIMIGEKCAELITTR